MPDALPTREEVAVVLAEHEEHVWGELGLGMFSCFPPKRLAHGDRCTPYRLALLAQQQAEQIEQLKGETSFWANR